MARPLRIMFEGACYHIMNRGLEKRNIFLDNNHRNLFLDLLSEISERFKVDIHAYCLMNNHYHLLLTTNLANLDLVMKHLNSIYTSKFNKDVGRDGPLFRGRYKSILVEEDEYFFNVSRYIHKNPSEAQIIKDDARYKWSSYQYYCHKSFRSPDWLRRSKTLSYFSNSNKKYRKFVEKSIDDDTRKFYSLDRMKPIFGNNDFIKSITVKFFSSQISKDISNKEQIIANKYPSLQETLLFVEQACNINAEIILNNRSRKYIFARNTLLYLLLLNPRYKMVEKAKFLGIKSDSLYRANKRLIDKMSVDYELKKKIEKITKEFSSYFSYV